MVSRSPAVKEMNLATDADEQRQRLAALIAEVRGQPERAGAIEEELRVQVQQSMAKLWDARGRFDGDPEEQWEMATEVGGSFAALVVRLALPPDGSVD